MKRIALSASLLVAALSVVQTPGPAHATTSSWCALNGNTTPCVLSATRNGSNITDSDPNWNFDLLDVSSGGAHDWLWGLTYNGSNDVGASEKTNPWDVVFDFGTIVPRVVFTHGSTVFIARDASNTPTDYTVEVTANPITLSNSCNQTSWPWTCDDTPTDSGQYWNGFLGGEITDFGQWTDVDQRNAIYGMDYSTNIDATDIPPQLLGDPSTDTAQILVDLANAHFQPDGSTVFEGNLHLVIPKAYLRAVYGIDDPTSLTGTGVVPSLTGSEGGTVTTSLDPSNNVVVDGSNIQFTARRIHLKRGRITPTAPGHLHGSRPGPAKGKLAFTAAKSRGSKITKYVAQCTSGSQRRSASAKASPIVVSLTAGKAYSCKVAAMSRAGRGAWARTTIRA